MLRLRRRYDVWLGGVERSVLLGFAVYSAFQTVNDAFMQKWMMRYFHWWVSASVVSFEVALLIWIAPLLQPLPPTAPPPALFSEEASVAMLKQVLERMRRIAEEMKRIARSKWKWFDGEGHQWFLKLLSGEAQNRANVVHEFRSRLHIERAFLTL